MLNFIKCNSSCLSIFLVGETWQATVYGLIPHWTPLWIRGLTVVAFNTITVSPRSAEVLMFPFILIHATQTENLRVGAFVQILPPHFF